VKNSGNYEYEAWLASTMAHFEVPSFHINQELSLEQQFTTTENIPVKQL
jgi:hypothetical protein